MSYLRDIEMFFGASPALFEFARKLRTRETEAEKIIWTQINKKQLDGYRFRRQHPIVYFIADFYCHTAKLVVEIDGGIHLKGVQYRYDRNRDDELKKHGIRVVRFTNEEVMNNIDDVINRLKTLLNEKA